MTDTNEEKRNFLQGDESSLTVIAGDMSQRSYTWDDFHPSETRRKMKKFLRWTCSLFSPIESVLTFSTKEIDVIFELKFENEILIDVVEFIRQRTPIAEQRQRRQRKFILKAEKKISIEAQENLLSPFYLISFVEKQTEIRENNPQLLPAVGIFKFSKQIATHLIFDRPSVIVDRNREASMPTNVHRGVRSMLNRRAFGRIEIFFFEIISERMVEIFWRSWNNGIRFSTKDDAERSFYRSISSSTRTDCFVHRAANAKLRSSFENLPTNDFFLILNFKTRRKFFSNRKTENWRFYLAANKNDRFAEKIVKEFGIRWSSSVSSIWNIFFTLMFFSPRKTNFHSSERNFPVEFELKNLTRTSRAIN